MYQPYYDLLVHNKWKYNYRDCSQRVLVLLIIMCYRMPDDSERKMVGTQNES